MSPGAAWIVRLILAGKRNRSRCPRCRRRCRWRGKPALATAIATWASASQCEISDRHLTRRPDGTPVVGQFGSPAVPLPQPGLNNCLLAPPGDELRRAAEGSAPRQRSARGQIWVWRAGSRCGGDSNRRRRLDSWLLMPASRRLPLLPGQESVRGSASRCGRNEHGERVAADLSRRSGKPGRSLAAAAGTLAAGCEKRRCARLGPASEPRLPIETQDTAPLVLSGIRDGGGDKTSRVRRG